MDELNTYLTERAKGILSESFSLGLKVLQRGGYPTDEELRAISKLEGEAELLGQLMDKFFTKKES